MIEIFSQTEREQAIREKKKLLIFYFSILFVFVVAIAIIMVFQNRENQIVMQILAITLSTVMGCFTLFFFAIKYKLTRKYVRMLKDIDVGLSDSIVAKFVCFEKDIELKDGVHFYRMILDADPLKREDITTRKVLIEQSVPQIEMEVGQKIRIVTHANILVRYELLD